jgi:hypothetical protein
MCYHDNNDSDAGPEVVAANRELEVALGSLAPAPGRVDPVAAAFAAGRNAGRRDLLAWRAAACIALVGAALSWLAPAGRNQTADRRDAPGPTQPPLIVVAERPLPRVGDVDHPLPVQSVLAMRRTVSEGGLQGVPAPRPPMPRRVRDEQLF